MKLIISYSLKVFYLHQCSMSFENLAKALFSLHKKITAHLKWRNFGSEKIWCNWCKMKMFSVRKFTKIRIKSMKVPQNDLSSIYIRAKFSP